jgi:hypothetical protein
MTYRTATEASTPITTPSASPPRAVRQPPPQPPRLARAQHSVSIGVSECPLLVMPEARIKRILGRLAPHSHLFIHSRAAVVTKPLRHVHSGQGNRHTHGLGTYVPPSPEIVP